MTSKIRVLNENTINKIAAGEVVENPASVVKELIENSLDAGAWEITIEIKSGGKQLIRVTDDGCGMSNDDALLCFERHATSKIQRLEDLEKIASMGFRGEALPSIASVSKLTLVTCPKTETKGPSAATMVIVEGGRMMKHCSAARSSGTTIEIKSLFFNVPARKKFQKSIQQDTTDVLKVVTLQALANPNIKLTLIGHHQTLLSAPAFGDISFQEALKRRTKTVLGADFLNNLCPVEATEGDYSLTGFIGKPFFTRNNRTGQYLFLNQRPVFSPAISSAILQGYGTAIASQRYPVCVLHLNMPGAAVDVNVHPQKREIRLREEQKLKEWISESVEKALQRSGVKRHPGFSTAPFVSTTSSFEKNPPFSFWSQGKEEQKQEEHAIHLEKISALQVFPEAQSPDFFQSCQSLPPSPKVLGTINHYVLLEGETISDEQATQQSEGGLAILDQRAAHRRILFEKILQSLAGAPNSHSVELQTLLVPFTLECIPVEAAIIRENCEAFRKMGILIEEFGPNAFKIDALSPFFPTDDIAAFVLDIVHDLSQSKNSTALKKEKEKRIALFASLRAVPQDKRLSMEEAQTLVNALFQCQFPYQCPQGGPTITFISQETLVKQFQ